MGIALVLASIVLLVIGWLFSGMTGMIVEKRHESNGEIAVYTVISFAALALAGTGFFIAGGL